MIKQKFNDNWFFDYGTGETVAMQGGAPDVRKKVTLPHDASIALPRVNNPAERGNGYFVEKNCYYEKKFTIEREFENSSVWFEFEGVYQNSFVYINHDFAGKCPYGYSNFYIDATKFIRFGEENTIKVIIKNEVPSGRWYTGCGIYRDVNLMIADRLHIAADGVRLTTIDADDTLAAISVDVELDYIGIGTKSIRLVTELIDENGAIAAHEDTPFTIYEGTHDTYRQRIYVKNPRLWDEENPYLYEYRTTIMKDGNNAVIDEERGSFGIRKLQLDPIHGLRVNGKTVKLRGGCLHHDTGITGTAEFKHAEEFRVKRLKEAGYNAIRSSHYPMSRIFLDACDKYGMYVMDEFADVWTSTKVAFDYGQHMSEWWEHDIDNMVRKDYNHPCVIMYSIGNEISETGSKIDLQWGKKLADRLRMLDSSRYVTNCLNLLLSIMDRYPAIFALVRDEKQKKMAAGGEINESMTNMGDAMGLFGASDAVGAYMEEVSTQVDITGYNYAAPRYARDAELFPNRIVVGSETFPKDLDINWELVLKYPHVIGDFDWVAWDYLGEAGIGVIRYDGSKGFYSPYPCKAAYCGDINLLGDRRPISYWREIIWGLYDKPYLSVQPPCYYGVEKQMSPWCMTDAIRCWNFAGYEGKPVVVEVYADADEAELIINGRSVGKAVIGTEKKFIAHFDTVYEPGELTVITYKDGVEQGSDTIKTASDKVQLSATADVASIPADGSDVGYIEISLKDEDGIFNPGAVKSVTVSIEGPGVILGFGNADPHSEENYFDTTAKTYEGRLRAAVRGSGEAGEIKVKFTAEGCPDCAVSILAE